MVFRPIVIFGPLADIARQLLVSNFSMRFASPPDEGVLRPAAIDSIMASNRHCVLDVTPG
jgi:tight junction protein 1